MEKTLCLDGSQKGTVYRSKKLHEQAQEILDEIGYQIDVNMMVKSLSLENQITEIAKAWASNPRILILDEPTSSLNKKESKILFRFIENVLKKNVCVIMISHRMEDIYQTCTKVLVLKDGKFVFEGFLKETTEDMLISKMVGRDFSECISGTKKRESREIESLDPKWCGRF